MPRKYVRKADRIITGVIDPPDPPIIGRTHSRVRSLLEEHGVKYHALKIVDQLLQEDAMRQAQSAGPGKLLQAATIRRQAVAALPPAPTRGTKTQAKSNRAKREIVGQRLTLFVMEHLDTTSTKTSREIIKLVRDTGTKVDRINGVLATLQRMGHIKYIGDGYRLTAKGHQHALRYRTMLEREGQVIKQGWVVPADYPTDRHYRRRKIAEYENAAVTH